MSMARVTHGDDDPEADRWRKLLPKRLGAGTAGDTAGVLLGIRINLRLPAFGKMD